ncbi:MAG: 2-oxo-4-hydroxy-4-carboxy-5-ureidoimidazoline decarboxylase [Roseibium sp.]
MTVAARLQDLNDAPRDAARRMLEPIVERSAWVADIAIDRRPFPTAGDLARCLVEIILTSGFDRQVRLFRVHPELAGREATEGRMTDASTDEQSRLGLMSLDPRQAARLYRMNAAYAARFGHPFILALHRVPDLQTMFDIFDRRLASAPIEEHVATLAEIASVISNRVERAFELRQGEDAEQGTATVPDVGRQPARLREADDV